METQKTLYDHQNPSKPIIVQTSPTKIDIRMERGKQNLLKIVLIHLYFAQLAQ